MAIFENNVGTAAVVNVHFKYNAAYSVITIIILFIIQLKWSIEQHFHDYDCSSFFSDKLDNAVPLSWKQHNVCNSERIFS